MPQINCSLSGFRVCVWAFLWYVLPHMTFVRIKWDAICQQLGLVPGTTSGLNKRGSLLNENDHNVITTQRRYLGRDQDGSCGPDRPLVAALLYPPTLDSMWVTWAQGRGRMPQAKQLWWTPMFASLSVHLYGIEMRMPKKVVEWCFRLRLSHTTRWGPGFATGMGVGVGMSIMRITSTHPCMSLEHSNQVTSSVSCGSTHVLRNHCISASPLKLCFS